MNTTETCDTSIERQFCKNSEYVRFLKLRLLLKCTHWFEWDKSDLTYANLISNWKFRGYLRPQWPQKSYFHSSMILQWYFWLEVALGASSQTWLSLIPQHLRTASSQKYLSNMIFECELTNVRLLRSLWPQKSLEILS